jgi:L-ribulose-5-phosphate 3-epimerase
MARPTVGVMHNPDANPRAKTSLSRRAMLMRSLAGLAGVATAGTLTPPSAAAPARRFHIGACDWSIGRLGDPGAFEVAKAIGLDGLQVSLGTESNGMHLRRPEVQDRYRAITRSTGLVIGSLAIGELNSIPYKSDPRTVEWVRDSIAVCQTMGCRVVLLAFFGNGDLKDDKPGTDEVVRRLREVAPIAEKAGVILGIESWLSAEEHVAIIDRVGSRAVQVYYDVANSEKMGYDIYREIRWLGRQNLICEFHAKENGFLLGEGRVDFQKVRAALDDIGYAGWVQIEGAIPNGAEMLPSYRHNQAFLRRLLEA